MYDLVKRAAAGVLCAGQALPLATSVRIPVVAELETAVAAVLTQSAP